MSRTEQDRRSKEMVPVMSVRITSSNIRFIRFTRRYVEAVSMTVVIIGNKFSRQEMFVCSR